MTRNVSEQLNGLRGFSALYIMLCHYLKSITPPIISICLSFGTELAMVFLMLSGFFAFYSYKKNPQITISQYLKKRLIRIYPIYLIAIALALLSEFIQAHSLSSISAVQMIGNLLCLQDDNKLLPGTFIEAVGGNLWYMSYQWWSYVLFILIVTISPKRYKSVAVILSFLGMLSYIIYPNQISKWIWYFIIFGTGCYIGECYEEKRQNKYAWFVIPIMLLIWIIAEDLHDKSLYPHPFLEIRNIGMAWIVLVFFAVMKAFNVHSIPLLSHFSIFAPFSFSVYLFQIPIRNICLHYVSNTWIAIILAIFVTLAISWLIEVKIQPMWLTRLKRVSHE